MYPSFRTVKDRTRNEINESETKEQNELALLEAEENEARVIITKERFAVYLETVLKENTKQKPTRNKE